MSTVKGLIEEYLDRINQPRLASYVSNTDPAARQYLSLFRFVANQLLDYQDGWSQLKKIYTFTTSLGVSNYQLPGDYLRALTNTQWGVTNQIPLAGPLSNARLAFQTYGVNIATPYAGFQINGGQGYIFNTAPYTQRSAGYFQISPAGQDNVTQNVIAYISSNFVWPTDWISGHTYSAGDKVTGINNIYITAAGGVAGATRPSWLTGSDTDGTVTWTVYNEPYPVTADTDFYLLDDELMIEGLRWAWYQSKKEDYQDLQQQWQGKVRTALGRQNGAINISASFDVNSTFQWPVVPVGSWSGAGGG